MSTRLPLFPLGTVLFPGVPLPLHIFEPRYRELVRDLMDLPAGAPRRFGVVAIRQGREVGADGVRALYGVGCTAEVRRVEAYDDGRFGLMTTGVSRFTVGTLDESRPYLQADVDFLPEHGSERGPLVTAVEDAYRTYLDALGTARGTPIDAPELPDEPLLLSYLVAATMLVHLHEKQRLLEAPDTTARLRAGLALLSREIRLLSLIAAVPPPEPLRAGTSLN